MLKQHLKPADAKRLSDKFEFIYTTPKASWLNMIEIEFRQFLDYF